MLRLIPVIALLSPIFVLSQQKQKSSKGSFQASTGFAVLIGESESSWQAQLGGGLRLSKWYAGLGTAIDNYRFRSVPVYASVRRYDLFRNSLFGYADAGIAIPWDRNVMNDEGFFSEQQKFYTGFYSETGIGYRVSTNDKITVDIAVGYSFRTMKERLITPMTWSSMWPMPDQEIVKKHRFNVLTLRTIIGFAGK